MIYHINLEVKNKMAVQKQDGGQISNSNVNTLNNTPVALLTIVEHS